jgi:hypothetical protein
VSYIDDYADGLSSLTAQVFEDEVCTRLEHVLIGFQRIPAKPQGDGGLDGFSHGGEHGYCCYGPIPNSFKKPKDLEADIIGKFSNDLLRLCELFRENEKLVCKPNLALPKILPNGVKLKQIVLIANWFESHNVIGPLHTAFKTFKSKSKCAFVDSDAQIRIIGPKEFAQHYHADEVAILQLATRLVISKIQVAAATVDIADPKEFDNKMAVLQEIRPDKLSVIEMFAEQLRTSWRSNLAFEQELDSTLPGLHQALEDGRRRILGKVLQRMMKSEEPWNELVDMAAEAQAILKSDFNQYGSLLEDLSLGEVARLIGECPIGWEKPN